MDLSGSASSDKALSQPKMTLFSALGPSVEMTPQTLQDAVGGRTFIEFYVACIAMVLFVGHNEYVVAAQQLLSFPNAAASSLLAFLLSWICVLAFFTTLRTLCAKGWLRSFYMPFFTIPMVFLPFFVMRYYFSYMIPDFEDVPIITEKRVRDIGLILVFEYLWVRHVARLSVLEREVSKTSVPPSVQPDAILPSSDPEQETSDLDQREWDADDVQGFPTDEGDEDLSPAPDERLITAVGVEIPIDDLLFVRSEQHNLRFVYSDREFTCRGRLKDLCCQIPQDCGAQANRSTWVAFGSIVNVDESSSDILVWFNDTQKVKVTTMYSMAFGIAYQAYLAKLRAL